MAIGMSPNLALGTANPSESTEDSVIVYIGAHASFDRYVFSLSNYETCAVTGFTMTKAE